jgi:hypothetical protein
MSTLSTTNLKNPSSGSNNIVLNADGTTTVTAPSNIIKSGTAVASTSGVSIDFTGIPSWAKRITVMFNGVSTNGTSNPLIQLGDSGGIETTGYASTTVGTDNTTLGTGSSTAGAIIAYQTALDTKSGQMVFSTLGSNAWVFTGLFKLSTTQFSYCAGNKTLSDTLDRLRVTTVNGTDTFDAGSINILYEG